MTSTTHDSSGDNPVEEKTRAAAGNSGASSGSAKPVCLYCAGSHFVPLYQNVRDRLRYVEGSWDFIRCTQCGSALLWPQPDLSELPSFYPPVYCFAPDSGQTSSLKRWLSLVEHRCVYGPMYRGDARRIDRNTRTSVARRKMLDIGCGRGLRLLAFQNLGYSVVGMDFQEDVVAYINNHLNIPAHCTTIDELLTTFAPGDFDLVTAYHLVEHVLDVAEVFEACYQLLHPGGCVAAAVPLLDSFQSSLLRGRWAPVTEAPRHVSLPTQEGFCLAAANAGFEQLRVVADSLLACSGTFALSVTPSTASTTLYSDSRLFPIVQRLFGLGVACAALPICALENWVAHRPAYGILVGMKPS